VTRSIILGHLPSAGISTEKLLPGTTIDYISPLSQVKAYMQTAVTASRAWAAGMHDRSGQAVDQHQPPPPAAL